MFNYFRNRKIRNIFSRFPSIDYTDKRWLIKDLKVREDRLRSTLHLHRSIESSLIADRIVLIDQAINILVSDNYKDNLEECMTIRMVYESILK
ncbi:hypothetical protein M2444_005606 [Paenibacillus sp. PastF-3]|nr:hypothetical protein [Paenibacillus sp. PastF-3]